jgi:hypothetical protein
MNNIQHLATEKHDHLSLTLNPPSPPSPERAIAHYAYHSHPVLSTDGVRAQRRFVQLNARAIESGRHRAFAGTWSRYRFHEDGFAARLRAAAVLPGVAPPFAIVDADVELGEPLWGVIARVFDVPNAVRVYSILIMGSVGLTRFDLLSSMVTVVFEERLVGFQLPPVEAGDIQRADRDKVVENLARFRPSQARFGGYTGDDTDGSWCGGPYRFWGTG